jgi:hypothetical protein
MMFMKTKIYKPFKSTTYIQRPISHKKLATKLFKNNKKKPTNIFFFPAANIHDDHAS